MEIQISAHCHVIAKWELGKRNKNGFLRNNLQQKWILKKKSATTNEFSAAPNDVNGAHLSRIHLLAQRFQTPTHPLSFKNGNLGSRKYLPISQIIQN